MTLLNGSHPQGSGATPNECLETGPWVGSSKSSLLEVIMHFKHMGEHDVSCFFFLVFSERRPNCLIPGKSCQDFYLEKHSNDLSASRLIQTEAD